MGTGPTTGPGQLRRVLGGLAAGEFCDVERRHHGNICRLRPADRRCLPVGLVDPTESGAPRGDLRGLSGPAGGPQPHPPTPRPLGLPALVAVVTTCLGSGGFRFREFVLVHAEVVVSLRPSVVRRARFGLGRWRRNSIIALVLHLLEHLNRGRRRRECPCRRPCPRPAAPPLVPGHGAAASKRASNSLAPWTTTSFHGCLGTHRL